MTLYMKELDLTKKIKYVLYMHVCKRMLIIYRLNTCEQQ